MKLVFKIGQKITDYLEVIGSRIEGKTPKIPCKCLCGNIKNISIYSLKRVKACGCLSKKHLVEGQFKRLGSLPKNGKKKCSKCFKIRSEKYYSKSTTTIDKLSSQCKTCDRFKRYKGLYNITSKEFNDLLNKQNKKCAICNRTAKEAKSSNGRTKYLVIDHCHKTRKMRGLLCLQCNIGIGEFGDNPENLYKAYLYLKNNKI